MFMGEIKADYYRACSADKHRFPDSELLPVIFKLTGRANCFIQAKLCAKPHHWASTHIALQPPNYRPNYSYRTERVWQAWRANHTAFRDTGLWPFQSTLLKSAPSSLSLPRFVLFCLQKSQLDGDGDIRVEVHNSYLLHYYFTDGSLPCYWFSILNLLLILFDSLVILFFMLSWIPILFCRFLFRFDFHFLYVSTHLFGLLCHFMCFSTVWMIVTLCKTLLRLFDWFLLVLGFFLGGGHIFWFFCPYSDCLSQQMRRECLAFIYFTQIWDWDLRFNCSENKKKGWASGSSVCFVGATLSRTFIDFPWEYFVVIVVIAIFYFVQKKGYGLDFVSLSIVLFVLNLFLFFLDGLNLNMLMLQAAPLIFINSLYLIN